MQPLNGNLKTHSDGDADAISPGRLNATDLKPMQVGSDRAREDVGRATACHVKLRAELAEAGKI